MPVPSTTGPRLAALATTALVIAVGGSVRAEPSVRHPPRPLLKQAVQSIEQGRPDRALAALEPLVERYPRSARLWLHLGLAHEKQRQFATAADRFRRALELDPGLHRARTPLAWCLYYLGELDAAHELFRSAAAHDAMDARARLGLGLIELDRDRTDDARARLLQAIELAAAGRDHPTEAAARARLADVELGAGRLEAARRLLVVAIRLDPQDASLYFKLSRVLLRLGDEDGADRALAARRAIREGVPEAAP